MLINEKKYWVDGHQNEYMYVKYDKVNMFYKAQHHQITGSIRPLVRA